MLNLLPKDQKKKLIREYRIRFWIVVLALALTGEVISLILLIPPYLTAETRINSLNAQSAGLKAQDVTAETAKLTNIVRQTNTYINLFNSSSTPAGSVAALQNVVSLRGKAVRLTGFVYKLQNGQQQIAVNGVADSRQALLDFSNRLKNQAGVISSEVPVSNFAQSSNINFSVNVVEKIQQP